MVTQFQLPEFREDISDFRIIPATYCGKELEIEEEIFQIKTSEYVQRTKSQYLIIERELIRTFEYVEPNITNKNTNSVKFASIIREACNLFELVSRELYRNMFITNMSKLNKLNIKDFLLLDLKLNFSSKELTSLYILTSSNAVMNKITPFKELSEWDKVSQIEKCFIPKWWLSYNKIKHHEDGVKHATLENALLAVSAVYVLIDSIYGVGVLNGELRQYSTLNFLYSSYVNYKIEESKLFTNIAYKSERLF